MLINATHWSDMLTSPATLCALFLLALFFVGELVTFFCTTVPRQASAWLASSNIVILGRIGGLAPHRVVSMDHVDHAVALDEPSSWITVARADLPPTAPNTSTGPEHLRDFVRWLAERGRLSEWPQHGTDSRG